MRIPNRSDETNTFIGTLFLGGGIIAVMLGALFHTLIGANALIIVDYILFGIVTIIGLIWTLVLAADGDLDFSYLEKEIEDGG